MESTHAVSCEGSREPQGGNALAGDRTELRERANAGGDRSSLRGCQPSARAGAVGDRLPSFLYASTDTSQAGSKGSAGGHFRRKAVRRRRRAHVLRAELRGPTAPIRRLRRQDPQRCQAEPLPIEQPAKLTLVVNLKTARLLGITISESIILRADEVIR